MLEPDQVKMLELLRAAFKTVSTVGHTPFDDKTYPCFLQSHDLTDASVFPLKFEISGFVGNGRALILELAKSIRATSASNLRTVSTITLAGVLRNKLTALLRDRGNVPLDAECLQKFDDDLAAWFKSHEEIRTHYIPCIISPWRDAAFAIGPVRFCHVFDFPVSDFGMSSEEFDALEETDDFFGLTGLRHFMAERRADWLAIVGIADQEPKHAMMTADLSVDVALAILQLVTPLDHYRFVARSTARTMPAWRPNVVRTLGGGSGGLSIHQPGGTVAPSGLGVILAKLRSQIQSMGARLTGYVDGSSRLPTLDETWCNAAYWYHEALAEPLETVAVAKLETSIEVLFRSVSSSGSTKRLIEGLEIFFGLKRDDLLPNGNMTAGEFAAAIVTARSRVLHGTWQTLTSDLPAGKGGKAIGFRETEVLTRSLLVAVSVAIDKYATQETPEDQVESFLEWCRLKNAGGGQSDAR